MMATATPTLHDVLRARWQAAEPDLHPYQQGASGDPLKDVLRTTYLALAGDWHVWVSSELTLDAINLADGWAKETEALVVEAGRAAFSAHVVPAVIDVLVQRLAEYPRWVAASPDASDELRADLALLEAAS